MISAIRPTDNKTSFTSVVPVRVMIDNQEVYSEKLVRPAVLQFTKILAGPVKNNEKLLGIIKRFGLVDPDYSVTKGINGYPILFGEKKVQPSNYFIYIAKKHAHYLFSGQQSKKVRELGKEVGLERHAMKIRGASESLDLQVAQSNYYGTINQFIRSQVLRLTESFNPKTKEKCGDTISLVLHMSSNKKYGQKGFKMNLDDISFTKTS